AAASEGSTRGHGREWDDATAVGQLVGLHQAAASVWHGALSAAPSSVRVAASLPRLPVPRLGLGATLPLMLDCIRLAASWLVFLSLARPQCQCAFAFVFSLLCSARSVCGGSDATERHNADANFLPRPL